MSVLNIGARALIANQTVLQTTGSNIANVNTPGYSRQSVQLQTVLGQYTGSGYIGKGVDVATITRNYSDFLTRQSTMAGAISSADTKRSDQLKQLENLFPTGASGLGAAVSDMLNSFSDVASSPTDLTARTVALTRVSETASRMRSFSASLDQLQQGVDQEISQKVAAINSLATNIADVNKQIANAVSNGQPPNDLLDQRDQLIRNLNQYVQTTSIASADGTTGIFLGSQALVLRSTAASLTVTTDDFNDPLKSKIAVTRSGQTVTLDENNLGGGEVPALLRFQNTDMAEGRNLLGRLTLAVTTSMNDQHKLGLDMDGNVGGNLFTPTQFGNRNILNPTPTNIGIQASNLTLGIADLTKFAASDYEMSFAGKTTGTVTRKSDSVSTPFTFDPATGSFSFYNPATYANDLPSLDGLKLTAQGATPAAADRLLIKPFSTSANNISAEFSNPRSLTVASPVAAKMGAGNTGSLLLISLSALTNPPSVQTTKTPVELKFIDANTYTRSDTPGGVFTFTTGKTISGTEPATTPPSEWSAILQGSPQAGDTFTVFGIKDYSINPATNTPNNSNINFALNSGNASAMMGLRDTAMFDGSALTDGYANLISQIGVRTQSASYSAEVSGSIAANLEKDRTGVSGVNLDEEAAKLMQFQQAYQACAKVVQIAQGIFDTLMQTFR